MTELATADFRTVGPGDGILDLSHAAHGLLFQYPAEVAAEIKEFLATDDENADRAPRQRGDC